MAFWLQLHCFDAAQNANNLALPVQPMCLLSDATICHLTSSPQPTFLVPPKGATPRARCPDTEPDLSDHASYPCLGPAGTSAVPSVPDCTTRPRIVYRTDTRSRQADPCWRCAFSVQHTRRDQHQTTPADVHEECLACVEKEREHHRRQQTLLSSACLRLCLTASTSTDWSLNLDHRYYSRYAWRWREEGPLETTTCQHLTEMASVRPGSVSISCRLRPPCSPLMPLPPELCWPTFPPNR